MNKTNCILLLFLWFCSDLRGDVVISPPSGPPMSQFGVPDPFLTTQFTAPSIRYEQVYGNEDFLAAGNGPFLITAISFSQSLGSPHIDVTLPNVSMSFSTTAKTVNGLSSVFSENIGLNAQTVFSGSLHLVDNGTRPFGLTVTFQTPFAFDPHSGNLLLDFLNYQSLPIPPSGGYGGLDFQAACCDSVANLTALNVGAQAGSVGSGGLITRFTVTPIPEPGTWILSGLGFLFMFGSRCWSKSKSRPKDAPLPRPFE